MLWLSRDFNPGGFAQSQLSGRLNCEPAVGRIAIPAARKVRLPSTVARVANL
jgi:hypothetical protein